MHGASKRTWADWLGSLAFLACAWMGGGSPAQANGEHDDYFGSAMELHHEAHYLEAAAKFIVAYATGERQAVAAYNAACALARAGKIDGAFVWLERAYAQGFNLDDYLEEDDDLDSLRQDPRYARLRQRVYGDRMPQKEKNCGDDDEDDDDDVAEAEEEEEEEAEEEEVAEAPEIDDDDARGLYDAGRYAEAARAWLNEAKDDDDATAYYNAACAQSLGGDVSGALDTLERAVEAGWDDAEHMDRDDDLDNIRNHPRYRKIRAMAAAANAPAAYVAPRRGRGSPEWDEESPELEETVRQHPRMGQAWFNLGLARLSLGDPQEAAMAFEKAAALGYKRAASLYNVACSKAQAGEIDEAFAWLDKAMSAGFDQMWLFQNDDDLDPLRQDPRFRRFVQMSHHR